MGLNATGSAQNQASGYAGNIASGQLAQGNAQAAGTAGQAAAWGNTIGTLGGIAGQGTAAWVNSRRQADPNNTGNYLDIGRGGVY
jgi:hypothetical protein